MSRSPSTARSTCWRSSLAERSWTCCATISATPERTSGASRACAVRARCCSTGNPSARVCCSASRSMAPTSRRWRAWRPGAPVAVAGDLLVEPRAPVRVLHRGSSCSPRVPARSPLALGRGDPRGDGVEPVLCTGYQNILRAVRRAADAPIRQPSRDARSAAAPDRGRTPAGRARPLRRRRRPPRSAVAPRDPFVQVAHANVREVDTGAARVRRRPRGRHGGGPPRDRSDPGPGRGRRPAARRVSATGPGAGAGALRRARRRRARR